jgi:hypothetical protein
MIQTIVRNIILAVLAYLAGNSTFGEAVKQYVTPEVTNAIVLTVSTVLIILWSYAEKLLKGWITPSGKNLAPVIAFLAIAGISLGSLTGCATGGPSPSPAPAPSPIVTGGITLLTSAGVTAGLDFGVKDTAQRTKIAGYIDTIALLGNQLLNGQVTTPAQFQAYLTTNGVKADSEYSSLAAEATSLYATFVYPKIQAGGNGASINAYLSAFTMGLQSGAAVYAPATVTTSYAAPPATFRLPVGLRPIYGWHNAYNVQLAKE